MTKLLLVIAGLVAGVGVLAATGTLGKLRDSLPACDSYRAGAPSSSSAAVTTATDTNSPGTAPSGLSMASSW